ncbi:MAG: VWA domain-containing protein [Actinomycetota bacterium]
MPLVGLIALLITAATAVTAGSAPAGSAPDADPGTGSIVARAAGDRDPATGALLPLPGAVLTAFADASLTVPAGECTTDARGTCTITGLVAGTYHVAPVGDPPGDSFTRLETVMTSMDGRQRYAETVVVDEADPTTRRFLYRRANPAFPARCGVRTTLVYDVSGSISAGEAATMQRASMEFVDALAHTPSSVAIASFATSAPAAGNANLEPTSVLDDSGVAVVKAAIRALDRPDGDDRYTNWDAAFRSVVGQSDVVVLFTDGNPTVHGLPAQQPPVLTGFDQLDAGVASANAVKAAGARVLAVGVGDLDALSRENLSLVSGPVEDTDFAVTTFADVRTVFRRLADALCPGTPEAPDLPTPRFTG